MTATTLKPTTTTAKQIVKVTIDQLANILTNIEVVKGMALIANIEQLTEPKLLKKDRQTSVPFTGQIHKFSRLSIILNTEYETLVVNQLERENKEANEYIKGQNTMPIDFTNSKNNFIGTFNNEFVLQYKPNAKNMPETAYYLNGKLTDKNDLPDVLPSVSSATNQGTDKEIFWRKLYVKNIQSITIFGTRYELIKM